jgi:hypothetical protein
MIDSMEPDGQSPWYLHYIPSYALGAEALRRASAKASEGYPPTAKSAEAATLRCLKYSARLCAFIHGHSPWSSAQADKIWKTLFF